MNIRELIEKLQTMPQDLPVFLVDDKSTKYDREVRDVIHEDKQRPPYVVLDNYPPTREWLADLWRKV